MTEMFLCEASQECINMEWRCDGTRDCREGEDEQPELCGDDQSSQCPPSHHFKCPNTNNCIPRAWLCDGENDCKEDPEVSLSADEADCEADCGPDDVQCSNGLCVLAVFYCDGDDDYGDGSDKPPSCDYLSCPRHFLACVPWAKLCDGVRDCPGGGDENRTVCNSVLSQSSQGCSPAQFTCKNRLCNGQDDCGDCSPVRRPGTTSVRGSQVSRLLQVFLPPRLRPLARPGQLQG